MNVSIRQETNSDYHEVFNLIKESFQNEPMSDHREQFLVDRLMDSDSFVPELSLVAEVGNQILGYILLSKVKIEDGHHSHEALALAPVSVLPEYQRRGIGGKLISEAHRKAREMDFKGIVLLGHADYYPRFGYRRASDFGISLPFDVPSENCMAMELYPGAFQNISGMVEYPKGFFE
ncbi:GNAT family N-acetyltransferase [Echinicola shivajiensis]|uniref:GNAT family N-acetyltransferase n=1 Tax=Echinicola shivajiensis TaxID=1035916 RepID=UPI001BFCA241|nr:N-acetyltransferase [Echinicola shivajiensis]